MYLKERINATCEYTISFLKWSVIGVIIGILGGVVGSLFHKCIDYVTELRFEHNWFIYLLPVAAVLIVFIYKLFNRFGKIDTNRVLESIRSNKDIPVIMVPLIFVSTIVSHLVGASVGREGAALQIGGGIGYNIGKLFKLNENNMHTVVMTGMSAVFSALFGTPVTAAFFSIEVINVGKISYAGIVPCVVSAITAFGVAKLFGLSAVAFNIPEYEITSILVLKTVIISIALAVMAIAFCSVIKHTEHLFKKTLKNRYLRALVGGCIVLILSLVFNSGDYNGAGMNIIENAMKGIVKPEAFAVKLLFTAICIASGFKGGEIVPAFFVGSTLGCVIAGILGIDASVGAAIGFVALFCGVVNCPVASTFLAIEVFGTHYIIIFAIVCAVSYMMSGKYSLYKSQNIYFSKIEDKKSLQ